MIFLRVDTTKQPVIITPSAAAATTAAAAAVGKVDAVVDDDAVADTVAAALKGVATVVAANVCVTIIAAGWCCFQVGGISVGIDIGVVDAVGGLSIMA